jgi:hypothetical protein
VFVSIAGALLAGALAVVGVVAGTYRPRLPFDDGMVGDVDFSARVWSGAPADRSVEARAPMDSLVRTVLTLCRKAC